MQSASLLIAAGLQAREIPDSGNAMLLGDAKTQIATTRNQLLTPAVSAQFAASLAIQSPDFKAAAGEFRKYSSQLLDEIVTETKKTIDSACKGLTKLDPAEVTKALDRIGEAAPVLAAVGRLVRAGIEKLMRAIGALTALFGKDTLAKVKAEIGQLWSKFGAQDQTLLGTLLGVSTVKRRIEEILAPGTRLPAPVDGATNALPPVGSEFTRANQLLRGLIHAVDFAAVLLGMLHFVGPWLALVMGGAYLSVIGGALLVGGEYTGGRQLLHWARGVGQIAEAIA